MCSSAGAVSMQTLVERHASRIRGVLSCFDRMLIVGTLADIAHAVSFTREPNRRGIRIFDFTKFTEPLRYRIRDNAERLAKENGITSEFCPAASELHAGYHWSLSPIEYATDIVFRRREDVEPLYDHLVRTAVHAVKAEQVATFLGKKLDPRYLGEVGNNYDTRIQGTRIRHRMGRVALKMYDKFGHVLRIETVVNDVSFFKHHRTVEHRDGSRETKHAPVKRTLYSLGVLADLLRAANRRYLEILSSLDDDTVGRKHLEKLSQRVRDENRSDRGVNIFDPDERALLLALARGEFNLRGVQVRDLARRLLAWTRARISRHIKRLRMHGLLKRVHGTYKYHLTKLGRRVIAAAMRLQESSIIPALAGIQA